MPSLITTRITWLSEKELQDAKKKAKKYKNFSEFIRSLVQDFKKSK